MQSTLPYYKHNALTLAHAIKLFFENEIWLVHSLACDFPSLNASPFPCGHFILNELQLEPKVLRALTNIKFIPQSANTFPLSIIRETNDAKRLQLPFGYLNRNFQLTTFD